MGKELFMLATTILILFFNTLPNLSAQNATTNATASMGTSENQTFSELGKIPGNVRNDTLNDTGEAAQKIGEGAVDIMSNITGEIKEGVSGNSTNISK